VPRKAARRQCAPSLAVFNTPGWSYCPVKQIVVDNLAEPDFHAVDEMLRGVGALGETAEIHGDLCGLLCLLGDDAGPGWVARVLADGSDGASAEEIHRATALLESLAEQAFINLEAGEMGFSLLLPSDEDALEIRAASLGLWCQGFLHGLGTGGGAGHRNRVLEEGLTQDIIRDFSEISRAAFTEDETEAEAEAAYMEVVEFVRVSVQLVFEELQLIRSQAGGGTAH
jgi:uncharacterized protein YgfB (UPF0149 family)